MIHERFFLLLLFDIDSNSANSKSGKFASMSDKNIFHHLLSILMTLLCYLVCCSVCIINESMKVLDSVTESIEFHLWEFM